MYIEPFFLLFLTLLDIVYMDINDEDISFKPLNRCIIKYAMGLEDVVPRGEGARLIRELLDCI